VNMPASSFGVYHLWCDAGSAFPADDRCMTGRASGPTTPDVAADASVLRAGNHPQARALVRQLLLAAVAIGRGDPMAADILGSALETARGGGFCNTVVTTAPEVTSYLIEHTAPARSDPFSGQLITAAVQVRSAQPRIFRPGHVISEQLTRPSNASSSSCRPAPARRSQPASTWPSARSRPIYGPSTRSSGWRRARKLSNGPSTWACSDAIRLPDPCCCRAAAAIQPIHHVTRWR